MPDTTVTATATAPDRSPAAPATPEYVPTEAIAALLHCHTKTVWRLAGRGLIPPPVTLAGLRRWDLRGVLAAVKASETRPPLRA